VIQVYWFLFVATSSIALLLPPLRKIAGAAPDESTLEVKEW
jgi:hypothetical protein